MTNEERNFLNSQNDGFNSPIDVFKKLTLLLKYGGRNIEDKKEPTGVKDDKVDIDNINFMRDKMIGLHNKSVNNKLKMKIDNLPADNLNKEVHPKAVEILAIINKTNGLKQANKIKKRNKLDSNSINESSTFAISLPGDKEISKMVEKYLG